MTKCSWSGVRIRDSTMGGITCTIMSLWSSVSVPPCLTPVSSLVASTSMGESMLWEGGRSSTPNKLRYTTFMVTSGKTSPPSMRRERMCRSALWKSATYTLLGQPQLEANASSQTRPPKVLGSRTLNIPLRGLTSWTVQQCLPGRLSLCRQASMK